MEKEKAAPAEGEQGGKETPAPGKKGSEETEPPKEKGGATKPVALSSVGRGRSGGMSVAVGVAASASASSPPPLHKYTRCFSTILGLLVDHAPDAGCPLSALLDRLQETAVKDLLTFFRTPNEASKKKLDNPPSSLSGIQLPTEKRWWNAARRELVESVSKRMDLDEMQSLEMMQLYILDVLKAETFPADKSMCEEVCAFVAKERRTLIACLAEVYKLIGQRFSGAEWSTPLGKERASLLTTRATSWLSEGLIDRVLGAVTSLLNGSGPQLQSGDSVVQWELREARELRQLLELLLFIVDAFPEYATESYVQKLCGVLDPEDARKWEHVDRTAASVLQQLLDVTYSGLLLQVFNFPLLLDMRFSMQNRKSLTVKHALCKDGSSSESTNVTGCLRKAVSEYITSTSHAPGFWAPFVVGTHSFLQLCGDLQLLDAEICTPSPIHSLEEISYVSDFTEHFKTVFSSGVIAQLESSKILFKHAYGLAVAMASRSDLLVNIPGISSPLSTIMSSAIRREKGIHQLFWDRDADMLRDFIMDLQSFCPLDSSPLLDFLSSVISDTASADAVITAVLNDFSMFSFTLDPSSQETLLAPTELQNVEGNHGETTLIITKSFTEPIFEQTVEKNSIVVLTTPSRMASSLPFFRFEVEGGYSGLEFFLSQCLLLRDTLARHPEKIDPAVLITRLRLAISFLKLLAKVFTHSDPSLVSSVEQYMFGTGILMEECDTSPPPSSLLFFLLELVSLSSNLRACKLYQLHSELAGAACACFASVAVFQVPSLAQVEGALDQENWNLLQLSENQTGLYKGTRSFIKMCQVLVEKSLAMPLVEIPFLTDCMSFFRRQIFGNLSSRKYAILLEKWRLLHNSVNLLQSLVKFAHPVQLRSPLDSALGRSNRVADDLLCNPSSYNLYFQHLNLVLRSWKDCLVQDAVQEERKLENILVDLLQLLLVLLQYRHSAKIVDEKPNDASPLEEELLAFIRSESDIHHILVEIMCLMQSDNLRLQTLGMELTGLLCLSTLDLQSRPPSLIGFLGVNHCQQVIQSIQKRLCFKSTSQECKGVIIRLTQRSLLSQPGLAVRFLQSHEDKIPNVLTSADKLIRNLVTLLASSSLEPLSPTSSSSSRKRLELGDAALYESSLLACQGLQLILDLWCSSDFTLFIYDFFKPNADFWKQLVGLLPLSKLSLPLSSLSLGPFSTDLADECTTEAIRIRVLGIVFRLVSQQIFNDRFGPGNKLHLVLDQLKDLQLEEVLCGRVPKGAPSNFFQQKDSKGDKRDPAKVVREAFETAHHILEDNGIGTLDQWRQLSKERLHKLRLDPLVIDIVDEHIQHVVIGEAKLEFLTKAFEKELLRTLFEQVSDGRLFSETEHLRVSCQELLSQCIPDMPLEMLRNVCTMPDGSEREYGPSYLYDTLKAFEISGSEQLAGELAMLNCMQSLCDARCFLLQALCKFLIVTLPVFSLFHMPAPSLAVGLSSQISSSETVLCQEVSSISSRVLQGLLVEAEISVDAKKCCDEVSGVLASAVNHWYKLLVSQSSEEDPSPEESAVDVSTPVLHNVFSAFLESGNGSSVACSNILVAILRILPSACLDSLDSAVLVKLYQCFNDVEIRPLAYGVVCQILRFAKNSLTRSTVITTLAIELTLLPLALDDLQSEKKAVSSAASTFLLALAHCPQGAQTLIDHGSLGQLIAFLSTHSVPPIPYVVDAEGNTVRHIEHQVWCSVVRILATMFEQLPDSNELQTRIVVFMDTTSDSLLQSMLSVFDKRPFQLALLEQSLCVSRLLHAFSSVKPLPGVFVEHCLMMFSRIVEGRSPGQGVESFIGVCAQTSSAYLGSFAPRSIPERLSLEWSFLQASLLSRATVMSSSVLPAQGPSQGEGAQGSDTKANWLTAGLQKSRISQGFSLALLEGEVEVSKDGFESTVERLSYSILHTMLGIFTNVCRPVFSLTGSSSQEVVNPLFVMQRNGDGFPTLRTLLKCLSKAASGYKHLHRAGSLTPVSPSPGGGFPSGGDSGGSSTGGGSSSSNSGHEEEHRISWPSSMKALRTLHVNIMEQCVFIFLCQIEIYHRSEGVKIREDVKALMKEVLSEVENFASFLASLTETAPFYTPVVREGVPLFSNPQSEEQRSREQHKELEVFLKRAKDFLVKRSTSSS